MPCGGRGLAVSACAHRPSSQSREGARRGIPPDPGLGALGSVAACVSGRGRRCPLPTVWLSAGLQLRRERGGACRAPESCWGGRPSWPGHAPGHFLLSTEHSGGHSPVNLGAEPAGAGRKQSAAANLACPHRCPRGSPSVSTIWRCRSRGEGQWATVRGAGVRPWQRAQACVGASLGAGCQQKPCTPPLGSAGGTLRARTYSRGSRCLATRIPDGTTQ